MEASKEDAPNDIVQSLGTSHDQLHVPSPEKSKEGSDIEEDKLEASHFSDKSNDEIKLFDIKENQLKSKKSELMSQGRISISRDTLLSDLK